MWSNSQRNQTSQIAFAGNLERIVRRLHSTNPIDKIKSPSFNNIIRHPMALQLHEAPKKITQKTPESPLSTSVKNVPILELPPSVDNSSEMRDDEAGAATLAIVASKSPSVSTTPRNNNNNMHDNDDDCTSDYNDKNKVCIESCMEVVTNCGSQRCRKSFVVLMGILFVACGVFTLAGFLTGLSNFDSICVHINPAKDNLSKEELSLLSQHPELAYYSDDICVKKVAKVFSDFPCNCREMILMINNNSFNFTHLEKIFETFTIEGKDTKVVYYC